MRDRDSLHRFLFENLPVRGEIAQLDSAWRSVLERRDYPPPVQRILGESMAAAALLFATVKFERLLTLQLQSNGPLSLLVVQCTGDGALRAMARCADEIAETALDELCAGGTLVITIDLGAGREQYQGVVDIVGAKLSVALERYFEHSEQLSTRFHLAADAHGAAGLLLQRVPGETLDADAWNRIQQLGATVTKEELLGLEAQTVIRRLFHEEDVRLFDAQALAFRCACTRERTAAMLRSLGQQEIRDIIEEQSKVTVDCQFCGMVYKFDAVDAAGLFTETLQPNLPPTRH